jgi:hypothetical protein
VYSIELPLCLWILIPLSIAALTSVGWMCVIRWLKKEFSEELAEAIVATQGRQSWEVKDMSPDQEYRLDGIYEAPLGQVGSTGIIQISWRPEAMSWLQRASVGLKPDAWRRLKAFVSQAQKSGSTLMISQKFFHE